jgi:SAM-dependent methyltransferase
MNLRESWETHASQWIEWARTPGHDCYWRYHRDQFLQIVPSPGRRTIDVACGEGRLTRDLKALGHDVVGIDASPSLVAAAREADPLMDIRLADAGALPLDDASADLAIAFMSLHDIDDNWSLRCGRSRASSNRVADAAWRSFTRSIQPDVSKLWPPMRAS